MPSFNGNKPQEWVCESIVLTTTPGGYQMTSVSEKSIRQNYLNCLVEINNLRDVNASLEKRVEKLEILVEKMKGYEL
jgi:uncharacterized protein YjaG (DUF416 family)